MVIMNKNTNELSTKQRILKSAVYLFAQKGYTETTIRELATTVGLKEASIYNHFESKNAILEYILEEYAQVSRKFERPNLPTLKENPTADNILSCLMLSFPEDMMEYYLKELHVIMHEQHRNPIVRKFMSEHYILGTEKVYKGIIDKLIEFNILRPDMDADFWVKIHSSLIYSFSSRLLLGIGDSSADYSGMGMYELMRGMCNLMLEKCGVIKE